MTKTKKLIIISITIFVLIGVVITVFVMKKGSSDISDDEVFLDEDSSVNDSGFIVSSYMGKVEAQDASNVKKDPEKTVSEIYVKEGML